MTITIAEKFKKDALWMLSELKQDEMANAYSEYKIRFQLERASNDEPDLRSQRRMLRMLSDLKAIDATPFYNSSSLVEMIVQMQGTQSPPIGFHIQILQPKFDEVLADINAGKIPLVPIKMPAIPRLPDPQTSAAQKHFISLNKQRVMLDNRFVLASPHFNGENANVLEFLIANPNNTHTRGSIETALKKKVRKSFHHILNDLGFKGEVRKLFFDVSKASIKFRNHIPESEFAKMGIDEQMLATELSGLDRIDKKNDDQDGNSEKQ